MTSTYMSVTLRSLSPNRRARGLLARIGRQAVHDLDTRERQEDRGRRDHLPATTAASEHDPRARHDRGVDPDREVGRQAERGDTADLHAGQGPRLFGCRERRLARAETRANHAVDVEPMRRKDDANRVPTGLRFADDNDRVGRIVRVEAVGRTERRRVRQRWIAGEELVRYAAPRERLLEPRTVVIDVHVGRDRAGHGRSDQATGTTCFPSRPAPRSPRTAAAPCSDDQDATATRRAMESGRTVSRLPVRTSRSSWSIVPRKAGLALATRSPDG